MQLSLQKSADPLTNSNDPPAGGRRGDHCSMNLKRHPDTVMLLFVSLQRGDTMMYRQGWSFCVGKDKGRLPCDVGHQHEVPDSGSCCSVVVPRRDNISAAFVEMDPFSLLKYSDLWIVSPAGYTKHSDPPVPLCCC